jgi:hypothetical protein
VVCGAPAVLLDYERRGVAERVAYGVYRMNAIPAATAVR